MITFLGLSDFYLNINGDWFFLLIAIFLLLLFSLFVYRFTLPQVSKFKRISLAFLRSTILILILFLIFEPTLHFINESKVKKYNYIFVDNSNSIAIKDSNKNIDKIKNLIENLKDRNKENYKFFIFADKVDSLQNIENLKLEEPSTNFSSIYSFIKSRRSDIDKAVIVSDGIITQGEDPSYNFEKLQLKLFTVGIGDTSKQKDVSVENITYNQNIFVNKETQFEASILNKDFENQDVIVSLSEENQPIEKKSIKLNSSGLNKITFKYKPSKSGEKKLKIEVSRLNNEMSYQNNSKTFFVNVLSSKIKIGLIASSPSSDLSAINNSLKKEPDFEIYKYIQVEKNKIWKEPDNLKLDSINVFFLLNFPSSITANEDISKVIAQIDKGKPFFISISNYTDLTKLKLFEKYLPISLKNTSNEIQKIQAQINLNEFTTNFSQVSSSPSLWINLAPVDQINFQTVLKPESKIIVNSRLKDFELNNPLIAIRNIGNQRSMILNGYNFWYWQMQYAESSPDFFPNFIIETAKWLSQSKNKKYFSLTTNKKVFYQNENIELTAELFDQTMNPVDTSSVTVRIKNQSTSEDIILLSKGNGIYQADFTPNAIGEVFLEATNSYYRDANKSVSARIFINNIPAERVKTKMDEEFLKHLAYSTGGIYSFIDNAENILAEIDEITTNNNSVIEKSEIEIWNNINIIFFIILLFTAEWFIRKRIGMI